MDTNTAFQICSDNLANLPKEYKKWRDLNFYRTVWSFIKDFEIKERICEENMAFDYLLSLYLWLKPVLTIEIAHKQLCIQSATAIFEAVMIDYICQHITGEMEMVLKKVVKKFQAERIRQILTKQKVLGSKWSKYLENLIQLRNYIHLAKTGEHSDQISKYNPTKLSKRLSEFNEYMRQCYTQEQSIPF